MEANAKLIITSDGSIESTHVYIDGKEMRLIVSFDMEAHAPDIIKFIYTQLVPDTVYPNGSMSVKLNGNNNPLVYDIVLF